MQLLMLYVSAFNTCLDAAEAVENWNTFWELFQSLWNAIYMAGAGSLQWCLRFLTKCLEFGESCGQIVMDIMDNMIDQPYWTPLSTICMIVFAFIGVRVAVDLL